MPILGSWGTFAEWQSKTLVKSYSLLAVLEGYQGESGGKIEPMGVCGAGKIRRLALVFSPDLQNAQVRKTSVARRTGL
jgi:hypothetical protein